MSLFLISVVQLSSLVLWLIAVWMFAGGWVSESWVVVVPLACFTTIFNLVLIIAVHPSNKDNPRGSNTKVRRK